MSVNKAILIGNLGKDPELRYTPSGKAVATFSLATTERWTGQDGQKNETTTWHNIVAWGKQAEVIKEYLSKGRQVYIEGRIVNRSYDDKDGNKRYISEVVVQNFQFLGNRGATSTETEQLPPSESSAPSTPSSSKDESDDDLPF
ncbi:MAG: single-stranded DNA-binding protein [FCB group bacterium]|nr:single-stranded DNA-binding protein [FCB group bacterium]